jgi:hypothetical protein
MSKSLFSISLGFLLLSCGMPAFADQYDDCIGVCAQNLTQCVDQSRLTAGNVQEEQELTAACQKSKADCRQACTDAETQPQSQPQPQDQSQDQQPQE